MKRFLAQIAPKPTGEFQDIIGRVSTPRGVEIFSGEAGYENIGILLFFSRIIQAIAVIAGLWVVANVIIASYTYLTGGGKADSHQKVRDILTMSIIGLLIIVSSYTIAGLIGLIFFGDPTYIINPTIPEIPSL